MPAKKIIVVTGALGYQGTSIVRALLEDGTFAVRGLTRNPDSEKAQALRSQGVEMVKANYRDSASLVAAFIGTYGVFGLTNYWEYMDEQQEVDEAFAQIDAAMQTGVQHFVWSSVAANPNRYVAHWASKGRINEYLAKSGMPFTTIITNFYFENFLRFGFCQLKKVSDTKYVLDLPFIATDGPCGAFAVDDIGGYVLAVFKDPVTWLNKYLFVPPEIITPRDLVTYLNEELAATGRPEHVDLKETTREDFLRAPALFDSVPGSEEMWGNQENFYEASGKMSHYSSALPTPTGVPLTAEETAELEKLSAEVAVERTTFHQWVKANLVELLAVAGKA